MAMHDRRHLTLVEGEATATDTPSPSVMLHDLRERLHATDPWPLITYLSAVLDCAHGSAFGDTDLLDGVIDSFLAIDTQQTTAALHVLRLMVDDDLVAAVITYELEQRTQPVPAWLTGLASSTLGRASHVEGDGRDVLVLDVRLSGLFDTCLVVELAGGGAAVTGAYPVSMPYAAALAELTGAVQEVPLPAARGMLIRAGAASPARPVHRSPSWPAAQPMLCWLLSTMPNEQKGRSSAS